MKPFTRTFFFLSWWNFGHHEAFSRIFLSHGGILAITKPFHKVEFTKCTIWGKTLFIYVTKSIYIGPTSLKTLPLDFLECKLAQKGNLL
jgi:hypothetical protein